MAREWWRRLPAAERREYQRSETISRVELPPDRAFAARVESIERALAAADRDATERASQRLVNRITRGLAIGPVMISVRGRRPPDGGGELHGIYRPTEGDQHARISVWMRTAKRDQVVAPRTFLRTLLHEVGHHIDMELLDLPHSYHSKGFYQRESSLFRAVTRRSELAASVRRNRARQPPPPPRPADVRRGLDLLRAAVDDIAARRRRE